KLVFKIIHSTTIVLPAWDAACTEQGFKLKRMPQDVLTCWNSAFNMVDFGVLYDQVIESLTDKRRLGLAEFTIDEHEWDLLKQLREVLKDAMLFFSRSTPNLAMVILAMDYIDEVFTTGMLQKDTLDPAIRATVGLAKKTLNKYYECTDASKLYRIAIGE
ncbi:hypothetical protein SCLCIDRAFT_124411, partial [Scleroderma citrinum Foug A]